jgi:hypothetical protein
MRQGKPSRSPSRSRMSNASRSLKPQSDGREGRSLRWIIWQSSHTHARLHHYVKRLVQEPAEIVL